MKNQYSEMQNYGNYVYDPAIKLEEYGIFRRFSNITFSEIEKRGIPNNPSIQANYKIVKEYAQNIEENIQKGVGIFMMGDCGTLKTTFSIAVMRTLIEKEEQASKYTVYRNSCYFIPMTSLMDTLFTMQGMNREESAKFEKKIRSVKLLVIDDLGSENTDSNWIISKIDAIITERYNRMLPCIISTNLTPKLYENTYAERIRDRLRNSCKALLFSGKSVRMSES